MLEQLKKELQDKKNPEKAKIYQRFFKTGKGEYGEGDTFLGLTMGEQRELVKKYKNISLNEIQELLNTKIHEFRMVGLLILVYQYQKADEKQKKKIVDLYLKNYNNINNWDLVDLSAHKILGHFLLDKNTQILYEFAKSDHLWKKRISIIATAAFINLNQFDETLAISEILLNDKHDLIHKAVGWMLREVGKRDQSIEEEFLRKHYKKMPRTMLRYAIEKFEEKKRQRYLKGEI